MTEPKVYGPLVDDQTRCKHYATVLDIVALRFGCCERYYPCYKCHDETADHRRQPWPNDRAGEPAVLCGVCKRELLIAQYIYQDHCPFCRSSFNPGCSAHYDLYFEQPDSSG
ncbi:CHY zinc finger protein [Enteractinococcus coprophilus]|uniref:Putative CHY-type Zn-finger protein n=1 Tax=Enteractinococcus coprophilus TaxID=1027633 RepID=A0A543AG20_9MICC|nr:CHY zinc finger protein [Enteractinococcus coprophilus]TQL71507.1 putative CHY-type Zn-finger protein [Enteractinococcus coprophilus]